MNNHRILPLLVAATCSGWWLVPHSVATPLGGTGLLGTALENEQTLLQRLELEIGQSSGTPNTRTVVNDLFRERWTELFRVSLGGDLSCSNFDPMATIKNSFNSSSGRVKRTLESLPDAILASIDPLSLGAAAIQRSSPQTYESMMNGIGIGFDEHNVGHSFCKTAQQQILDKAPQGWYDNVAQAESMTSINKAIKAGQNINITDVFGEDSNTSIDTGNVGINTPSGYRGGSGQARFERNDIAGWGFNQIQSSSNTRSVRSTTVNTRSPRKITEYFSTSDDITEYLTNIIGNVSIATCEDCPEIESVPGLGIDQYIADTAGEYEELLHDLVSNKEIKDITESDLYTVSVYPYVSVNELIINSLQVEELSTRTQLISNLAYDLAAAEHTQRIHYVKQALIAGRSTPPLSKNAGVDKDVSDQIMLLDNELNKILETNSVKAALNSGTRTILQRRAIQNRYRDTSLPTTVNFED